MDRADPVKNRLLAALPEADLARIAPHLVLVSLSYGQTLYEPATLLRHVYFPTNSIISLISVTQESAPTELAIVGNEGVVGVAVFMAADTAAGRAVVQSAGEAYRLDARILKEEFRRASALQRLLLRYTQALMTQISQTAACNLHHSVEQQLCRWLLLSNDRLPSTALSISEEMIANMLGASKVDLDAALLHLAQMGLIRHSHGRIELLDRPGLEAHACECYRVVQLEFARLLPA